MNRLKSFIKHMDKLDHLLIFDQSKDLKGEIFKKFLSIYTEMGSTLVITVLIILVGIFDNYQLLYIFLPIYLFQLIIIEFIKMCFNRSRPHTYIHKNLLGISSKSGSFPSGHTSNIFCISYLICNYYQLGLIATMAVYFIAATVALTRIFLGKHFFVDVIAGAIMGILLAIIGTYIWIFTYTHTDLIRITL